MKKGVPVSPGIAVARAYCVDEILARREPQYLDESALAAEVARFDQTCAAVAAELDAVVSRVSKEVGEEASDIFRAHRLLLNDPVLISRVKNAILHRHVDARTALHETLDEYTALFSQIQDEYLKERMADIRDIFGRIINQLALQEGTPKLNPDEPVVIVASEILPSQATMFDRLQVAAIITESGGTSGHAAILARSLGIPAVSGLLGILREVQTGDLIALDAREGHVYLNPGAEVEAAYRKLRREYVDLRDKLIENRDLVPVSTDGVGVELLCNVNGQPDAEAAERVGATGVGLYRTEYLFLTHPSVPTEEEQVAAYRQVIESAPNRWVTIRTLDLGGDKNVPYLAHYREANPFMGWRSIRLIAAHPEFFKTQMRAILRAGIYGHISLLFPMISTLEEVQRLKKMLHKTKLELQRAGVAHTDHMPVGVMIEVPAAALCIDHLLEEVDFVCIGSNDLLQYVMAADRDNPKVAHLCEPFAPAIMKLLQAVIGACNDRGKSVTLCGEMAGRPRCFLALFGMGLRRLSMSPAFVPTIKEMVRCTDFTKAQEVAVKVLRMKTAGEVRGYLTRITTKICPNVAFLDTRE